ncbi:MAG: ferric reductase-like transmembrane domain-containing protein [Rhodocyclaceae bacterium]
MTRIYLAGFVLFVTMCAALSTSWDATSLPLSWLVRDRLLVLTGLLAISSMSAAMLLGIRPKWLCDRLGGPRAVVPLHKWSGILAAGFALLHWLVEMSDEVLEALFGDASEPHGGRGQLLHMLREAAEELGEFAIFVLFALVLLALWRHPALTPLRKLHRAMPLLYLGLLFHAIVLTPTSYWTQPLGFLLVGLGAAGGWSACLSLARLAYPAAPRLDGGNSR